MSDAHSGKGSGVGTVIPTIDAVTPVAVGVDIGCGIIAARTVFGASDGDGRDLGALRSSIEDVIPPSPGNCNHDLGRRSNKDIGVVMADAGDLVEIEHALRQVLNVRGT